MQFLEQLLQEIAALFMSVLMLFGGVTTPAAGDPLRNFADDVNIDFVVTGDPQVGDYLPEREANLMSFSEDMMNSEIDLDAFIIAGDIAENGMPHEFSRVADLIKDFNVGKYVMCTGNHDIRLRDFEESKSTFLGFMNDLNAEEDAQDNIYYKTMVGDYTFLVMGSEEMRFEDAFISREQLQWLNIELKNATAEGKPVFVICHYPLAEGHGLPSTWGSANSGAGDESLPTYERKDDYDMTGSIGDQTNDVYDILTKYENVFFITGHLHTGFGKFTYETISDKNNVQGVNVPSVGIDNKDGVYNNPGTGLLVEVTDSQVIFYARDFRNGKFLTTEDWSKAIMAFDII